MSLRTGMSTQTVDQLNQLFQDKWGEEFENAFDYPIWNYFLTEYSSRLKEDYFNTIYTDLKERFEILGAHLDAKVSGLHSDKEAKKKIKQAYVIDDQIKVRLFHLKDKMLNQLKQVGDIESRNQNIGNLKKIIDDKLYSIAMEISDDLNNHFKALMTELDEAGYILHCLSYLQTEFDAKKHQHYLELLDKIIEYYKRQKLNNEIKIFSERHPKKIFIKIGDKVNEIYTSNLIAFLQDEFSKHIEQFDHDNVDLFAKKEKVVRFAKKIAHVLDFLHSDDDLSAALLYVIENKKLKLVKKEVFFAKEKDLILSPPKLFLDRQKDEVVVIKADPKKKSGFYLSEGMKTALYIAGGVLVGVALVTAFVFGGGLPLLLGFLAIHLIHIAPLALKLILVVGGMLLGGGLGYGGKKVVEVVEENVKEEMTEDPISVPVVVEKEMPRPGSVNFDVPTGTSALGVFAKSEPRPVRARNAGESRSSDSTTTPTLDPHF